MAMSWADTFGYLTPKTTPDRDSDEVEIPELRYSSIQTIDVNDGEKLVGEAEFSMNEVMTEEVQLEQLDHHQPEAAPTTRKLSIHRRKHIVLYKRPQKILDSLKRSVQKKLRGAITEDELNNAVNHNLCWTYERITKSQTTHSKITINVTVDRSNKWSIQYGLAYLLVYDFLSLKQVRGLIRKNWHLSHLCGDWRCMNPRHFTVEPGETNWDRENCFKDRRCRYCFHGLKCREDKICKEVREKCSHSPPCIVRAKSKGWMRSDEQQALYLSYASDTFPPKKDLSEPNWCI